MGLFSRLFGKKYSNQELKILVHQAQRHVEIYNDSQKLFQSTKNPDVFFSRFDLALESLKELEKLIEDTDNAVGYEGDSIPDAIKALEDNKEEATNSFIERYFDISKERAEKLKTEKGRKKNASKSFDELMEYSDRLTDKQIEKANGLWSAIK